MRLIQYMSGTGRAVGCIDGDAAHTLSGAESVLALALAAARAGETLARVVGEHPKGAAIDVAALAAEQRLLPPIDHPDPAHMLVTGTGLTHLGSASARHGMHREEGEAPADDEPLTDSLKMFRMGLEGGKPGPGQTGVQPEWFYKGDGSTVVAPGAPLIAPAFAEDGGEEPEIAVLYVIADDGTPCRVGFALGNEFSDHVMEKANYLWLAHSKLRQSAFGPELLLGALPADIEGTSRILRGDQVLWEKPFLTGEDNMSHALANLEAHHFKYSLFRRPGDVHVHYLGTATLSYVDGIRVAPGDVFEISAPGFGTPLRNPLARAEPEAVIVRAL